MMRVWTSLLLLHFSIIDNVLCGHPPPIPPTGMAPVITTTTTTTTTTKPPPPPCSHSPCENSGNCTNTGSSYVCSCEAGYTGNQCEIVCVRLHQIVDLCDHTHSLSNLPDIVFIVDSSTGTGEEYFTKALEYIDKFVSYFNVGSSYFQFSVITYNFNSKVEFNLSDHDTTSTLRAAITNIAYSSGPSYTGAGLRMATDIFSKTTSGRRVGHPGHVIIISDGLSSNMTETQEEATSLKTSPFWIEVAAVVLGPQIFHEELLDLASSVLQVYTGTNTDLMHHVYRKYAQSCPDCVTKYADVEILLEVSVDLTRAEFNSLVDSLKFLLKVMNIGPSQIRVSLSHIWSDVQQMFSSDSYNDVEELIANIVTSASQKSGSTNASKAFDHMIQNGFSTSRGDRNVVILFSTGIFSDSDFNDAKTKAEDLKSGPNAVYIVTVGAGLGSNLTNLLDIASDPAFCFLIGDDLFVNKRALQALLSTLEFDFCSGYVD